MSIEIKKINYRLPEDARIMKACLETWFQNPKELHLTDPRMTYPFNFKKWVAHSYRFENTHTYVLKEKGWIVGMASLSVDVVQKKGHLFHVFIAPEYRHRELGKYLVQFVEAEAKMLGMKSLTLMVVEKNLPAIRLYESIGFSPVKVDRKNQLKMEKKSV